MSDSTLEQDAPSGAMCARCVSPLERDDLRCAICGLKTELEHALESDDAGANLSVAQLRCEGCGAAVEYDASSQQPLCPFCDSAMSMEDISDPMEQTSAWLPFAVSRDQAAATLKTWLGGLGWFRPADLLSDARVTALRPLWWVAWVFDAHAEVSWAADTDAGARRSSWAPHAGKVTLRFDDILVSASRGLSDEEALELTPGYDLVSAASEARLADGRAAKEAIHEGADAPTLERFDVQRSRARERILHVIENLSADTIAQKHLPGHHFRNLSVHPLLRRLDTRRLAFPAWVMAYRYHGKLYRAVVCGQDEQRIVAAAPYSWTKILLVALFGVLLAAGMVVVVIAMQ